MILLADGFEELEAIAVHDVLCRTHACQADFVGTMGSLAVRTSRGFSVQAHTLLEMVDPASYDFLVLPGGKLGVENLKKNEKVISLIKSFHEEGKGTYAICAAPSILGELGFLDGHDYTCFPGFQKGKGRYQEKGVVADGPCITGRSMAYSIPFAEEVARKELGEEALKSAFPGMYGGLREE